MAREKNSCCNTLIEIYYIALYKHKFETISIMKILLSNFRSIQIGVLTSLIDV